MYGASEPAVGADWFSAKAQDEFTEGIVGERQADIKEIDVLVASGVGVFQDVPQRQFIRMDDSKRLATEGGVPEVGVLLTVDNGRTADDVVMITGEIESSVTFLLDEIEDPHNLGAIIRTANLCGAHGVIIPKHRAAGLTSTAVRASAGAINYTPVVKVTNISKTIEELKERGVWFACADMQGEVMYRCNLKGPIGLVIGNEGNGVSRLVKEKCDYIVSIPMKGDIDSLNASVAAGVRCFEVVRQRMG